MNFINLNFRNPVDDSESTSTTPTPDYSSSLLAITQLVDGYWPNNKSTELASAPEHFPGVFQRPLVIARVVLVQLEYMRWSSRCWDKSGSEH